MTTLSKEDAIRAVLDGKTVQVRVRGAELEESWGNYDDGYGKLSAIEEIIRASGKYEFRIKPEPVVTYVPETWLWRYDSIAEVRGTYPKEVPVVRVEKHSDGTYKIEKVEE